MRLIHKLSPTTTVQIDAETQTDAFRQLAQATEVFSHATCGRCSGDVAYRVRTVDDNAFFEIACQDRSCGGVLAFGSHRKGSTLFPKRKTADGKFLPDDGWVRWTPDSKKS